MYSTGHATSGFTVLEWINILKQLRPFKSWTSGEFIHIFLEAGKLSLRDDDMWNSGKSSYKVPIEKLLSDSYAKELAAKIGERAQYYPPSSYLSYGNHTTSLSVLVGDEIITMTLTQMYGFERNGLLGDIGFSINDGMCYFSLNPKDKDFLSAGERPRHPFSPIIIENYNKNNIFSIGAAGGWTIPQTVVLTSIKILEFNEFIDYAVNSPRYVMRYRTNSIPYPPGTEVIIEEGIPYSTKMYLKSKGHKIAELTTLDESNKVGVVNGVQLINKKHFAGADKRRDGVGIAGII